MKIIARATTLKSFYSIIMNLHAMRSREGKYSFLCNSRVYECALLKLASYSTISLTKQLTSPVCLYWKETISLLMKYPSPWPAEHYTALPGHVSMLEARRVFSSCNHVSSQARALRQALYRSKLRTTPIRVEKSIRSVFEDMCRVYAGLYILR